MCFVLVTDTCHTVDASICPSTRCKIPSNKNFETDRLFPLVLHYCERADDDGRRARGGGVQELAGRRLWRALAWVHQLLIFCTA